jgi:hypothetical protein
MKSKDFIAAASGAFISVLLLPLLILAAILAIPFGVGAIWYQKMRDRRLFYRLRNCNRTISWLDIEQHLEAGRGTLIIEQAQKQGVRLWWTSDDVLSVTPHRPPSGSEIDYLCLDPSPHPFIGWCFQRYLSPLSGSAYLTRLEGLKLPPGFVSPEFFMGIYPAARVVATVLTQKPTSNA